MQAAVELHPKLVSRILMGTFKAQAISKMNFTLISFSSVKFGADAATFPCYV